MTNEQAVAQATVEIERLKQEYMTALMPLVGANKPNGSEVTLNQFLACQRRGNSYFNFVESFVGDSGLLGAHANGKWVTGFAETCASVLETFTYHIELLRSYSNILSQPFVEPNNCAFANMQRMVKEYVPRDKWKNLKDRMTKLNLPVSGFKSKAVPDVISTPKWQIVACLILGAIFLVLIVVLAVAIPSPTLFQTFVFRGLLAISLAAIAAIVPGFINIESRATMFSIRAGGAIAIFVIIWFANPPALIGS